MPLEVLDTQVCLEAPDTPDTPEVLGQPVILVSLELRGQAVLRVIAVTTAI